LQNNENIAQKKNDLGEAKKSCKKLEDSNKELVVSLEQLQRKFHAVSAGLSADVEGEKTKSMADKVMGIGHNRHVLQISEAKRNAASAATEIKQAELRIKHITSELKEKKKAVQALGKDQTALQNEYDISLKAVNQLKVLKIISL